MKIVTKTWFGLIVRTRLFIVSHNVLHVELIETVKVAGITVKEEHKELFIPSQVFSKEKDLGIIGEFFQELHEFIKELELH